MKPRSDSRLKTLPPAAQAELWQLLQSLSYRAAVRAVREKWGVTTSAGALSAWYRWYPLSRRLEQARTFADELTDKLRREGVDLDDEQLSRAAQVAFEVRALEEGDARLYLGLRKIRQKDQEARLTERRIVLLEQKAQQADAAKATLEDGALTAAEREQRMRAIFGLA